MYRFAAGARSLLLLPLICLLACGGGGGGGDGGPPPSEPDVWYVRASGNDDNSGDSAAAAFRTIQKAVDSALPGDTITVGPGLYEGLVEINRKGASAENSFVLVGDPTGGLTGDEPGPVRIEATTDDPPDPAGIRISQSTFVTIDGFTIGGARGGNAAGIVVRSSSNNTTIRNCEIIGNRDGVQIQDSNDALLFNNLIADNTNRAVRIGATTPENRPPGPGSQRARLINNTIATNGNNGVQIGDNRIQASAEAQLFNNIIEDNAPRNIDVSGNDPSSLEGYAADFNLVFTPLNECGLEGDARRCGYGPFTPRGANDVNVEAKFVNAARGDYRLQEDSPAIDAGTDQIGDDALVEMLQDGTATGRGTDELPLDLGYHLMAR